MMRRVSNRIVLCAHGAASVRMRSSVSTRGECQSWSILRPLDQALSPWVRKKVTAHLLQRALYFAVSPLDTMTIQRAWERVSNWLHLPRSRLSVYHKQKTWLYDCNVLGLCTPLAAVQCLPALCIAIVAPLPHTHQWLRTRCTMAGLTSERVELTMI